MTGGLWWFLSRFELKKAILGDKLSFSPMNTGASGYFINSNPRHSQPNINPSMVMPMLAMHMLVGNFFLTCLAHADDFDLKAQRFAGQRMVAV